MGDFSRATHLSVKTLRHYLRPDNPQLAQPTPVRVRTGQHCATRALMIDSTRGCASTAPRRDSCHRQADPHTMARRRVRSQRTLAQSPRASCSAGHAEYRRHVGAPRMSPGASRVVDGGITSGAAITFSLGGVPISYEASDSGAASSAHPTSTGSVGGPRHCRNLVRGRDAVEDPWREARAVASSRSG